jgi:hypothetical protein
MNSSGCCASISNGVRMSPGKSSGPWRYYRVIFAFCSPANPQTLPAFFSATAFMQYRNPPGPGPSREDVLEMGIADVANGLNPLQE